MVILLDLASGCDLDGLVGNEHCDAWLLWMFQHVRLHHASLFSDLPKNRLAGFGGRDGWQYCVGRSLMNLKC